MKSHLLVVDDEPNIRFTLSETLESSNLRVSLAGSGAEAIQKIQADPPDVALLDVRLPDMSGLELFSKIHAMDPRISVVIMTAFSKTDTAIEAMKRGAFEYLVKPVDLKQLKEVLNRALEVAKLSHTPALLAEDEHEDADYIVGDSPAMREVYKSIGRVASQDVTVLILGESGTGKELVARSIYHYSKRSKRPFLAVNCAALSESLLESELFGHEKGAFTGADKQRIGKFEQVNGGTIFLDEIGDMTLATQVKALRLLQQQQFERVGGNETIQTDVRIIAATNKDLPKMVAEGTFREDLYYRLNGFSIFLPSLRERKSDIPKLTEYFIRSFAKELNKSVRQISPDYHEAILAHSWPGNVRELASAVRYSILHSIGEVLTSECLPPMLRSNTVPTEWNHLVSDEVNRLMATGSKDIYRQVVQLVESMLLKEVLRITNGNQSHAAELLGISRVTLRAKIRHSHGDELEPAENL